MSHPALPPVTEGPPKPIIAVTMGDAAGVGPELCLRLLARKEHPGGAVPLVLGDAEVLSRVARQLKIPFNAPRLDESPKKLSAPAVYDPPGTLAGAAVVPGTNQFICGKAAAKYIELAAKGCLEGRYAAMVTAPISKKALHLAGINYPGHTEMLADICKVKLKERMLLYSKRIACIFVTCHQPLRTVPDSLNIARIVETAMAGWAAVTMIRGSSPRLALLGLNPHAGEEGLMGDEEIKILAPARELIAARGVQIDGPLPPDTAFTPAALQKYGLHVALYHDQGGIPFKMLSFDDGVNVTLGLPIIRTSPDHGTAFDIAWQGKARPDSFFSAYELAAKLSDSHLASGRATVHRQYPKEETRRL